MNRIASFRLCKLSNQELLEKIDKQTDEMFEKQQVPIRHIPARPDADYDLLIGELLIRFDKMEVVSKEMLEALENLENDDSAIPNHAWDKVKEAIQKANNILSKENSQINQTFYNENRTK